MTKPSKIPLRYDEGCLGAHALNLIGDRWALLVVRELIFAPKRFQMIRAGLPGITASVLTQRLGQLTEVGVVSHDADFGIYALTPSGRELMPVLQALCRWALIMPGHDPHRFISPTALMISLTVTGDPVTLAGNFSRGMVISGRENFAISADAEGRFVPSAERLTASDFTLQGSGNALAIAFYGPIPLNALAAAGEISLSGDQAAAQGFVDAFSLSAKA